jgi:hypothetical protein
MSRGLFTALAGSALVASALTPATAHAADFPSTTIRSNLSAVPKCIGPRNGDSANGTPIVVMDCNQLWRGTGAGGDHSIRSFGGKCLSLAPGHGIPTPLGTPVVLEDCTTPVNGDEQYTFVAVTPGGLDGRWVIRHNPSLRCVGVRNGSTDTNTPLILQECSFRPEQQMVLPSTPNTFGFSWDDGTTV